MTAVQVALSFNLLPLHTLQRLALVPFDDIIREGIIGSKRAFCTVTIFEDGQCDNGLVAITGRSPVFHMSKGSTLAALGKNLDNRRHLYVTLFLLGSTSNPRYLAARWSLISSINHFFSNFLSDPGVDPFSIIPRQLEVINKGLSYEESKTHFATWALMKLPLLIVNWP
ncbi:hypothetical protein EDD18DRAFT_1107530 [Armillaria luteobubalina]|uniref:Uncharacterized protein n=1 Tax=Armillaria luteobubalina TaxID=153913 RepID=A0AA39UMB2_9AGAR|nr:hypothetical protein EDD18DRAFT_1107530 [Armillaria luteobubalina]